MSFNNSNKSGGAADALGSIFVEGVRRSGRRGARVSAGDASVGTDDQNNKDKGKAVAGISSNTGQATSETATSRVLATRSRVKKGLANMASVSSASVGSAPAGLLPFMPVEMRIEIARQSLNKPAMHWVCLERCMEKMPCTLGSTYTIKMRPVAKRSDPSSFRKNDETLERFANMGLGRSDIFIGDMFLERAVLGFEKLTSEIDAATDMVCVHDIRDSRRVKDAHRGYNEKTSFHKYHEPSPFEVPWLHRDELEELLKGIRRVGVMIAPCSDMTNIGFSCRKASFGGLHEHEDHHGSYLFGICSVELAAFLDCFPDLEVAYMVMTESLGGVCAWPKGAEQYCQAYFKMPQMQKKTLGLDIFYDGAQKYVEVTKAGNDKLGGFADDSEAFTMLRVMDETRKVFTDRYDELPVVPGPDDTDVVCLEHTMSLERREAVEFKVVVTSGIRV